MSVDFDFGVWQNDDHIQYFVVGLMPHRWTAAGPWYCLILVATFHGNCLEIGKVKLLRTKIWSIRV